VLGVLFVPVFFVVVRRLLGDRAEPTEAAAPAPPPVAE